MKTGVLCFYHPKSVRFLGNIWSRRLENIGTCIWPCRRTLPLFPLHPVSDKNYCPHTSDIYSCLRMAGKRRSRRILRPIIPHCRSGKGRRKNYEKRGMPDNAPNLLSKYYSRVRVTISVFDWYEANLCPKVSPITKVGVKFIRVACSTESDILVLVCDRIILDVLRKNPTPLKKNPWRKKDKQKVIFFVHHHIP